MFAFELVLSCLVMIMTCAALCRRRIGTRLPVFTAFLFAATLQQCSVGGYFLLTGDGVGYTNVQSWLSPLFGILQAGACIEAYIWLVWCLVNFKKIGAILLVGLILASVEVGVYFAPAGLLWLDVVESVVGISLAAMLSMALVVFRVIGTPLIPRWHAGCLALLSAGNALGFYLVNGYVVMTTVIVAFLLWCFAVQTPPTWRSIKAAPFDGPGVESDWKKAQDTIDNALRAM